MLWQGEFQEKSYFWSLPMRMGDESGTPCADSDSRELVYLRSVFEWLDARPERFNTSQIYFGGESAGALAALYLTTCLHANGSPWKPKALWTHSSGLKIQGDGLLMQATPRMPWFTHGECPGCDFFPIVLSDAHAAPVAKACIFDSVSAAHRPSRRPRAQPTSTTDEHDLRTRPKKHERQAQPIGTTAPLRVTPEAPASHSACLTLSLPHHTSLPAHLP